MFSRNETHYHVQIDLKKMPLGKLSRRQIEEAYSVLTEAQTVRQKDHYHLFIYPFIYLLLGGFVGQKSFENTRLF